MPWTVSSTGKTWIRLPYLTSWQPWIDTTSPDRTRKLLRTTRFIRIRSLGHVSSARTIQIVSRRFLPLSITVSPRNNCNSSIFCWERATTLLSSFTASSMIRRLGRSFRLRMAVANLSSLVGSTGFAICFDWEWNWAVYKCYLQNTSSDRECVKTKRTNIYV